MTPGKSVLKQLSVHVCWFSW